MTIKTYTAKDAKNEFGKLLDEMQNAPVTITKHRREVGAVLSMKKLQHIANLILSEPLKESVLNKQLSVVEAIEEQLKIDEMREIALKQHQNGQSFEANSDFYADVKAEALKRAK